MEHVWLIASVATLGFGIHATIYQGIGKSYIFGILLVFTVLMYFWRRNLRKNDEE